MEVETVAGVTVTIIKSNFSHRCSSQRHTPGRMGLFKLEAFSLTISLPLGAALGSCHALRICRNAIGSAESGRLDGLSAQDSITGVHQRQRAHW